jgi:methionyl-tRNA synthetase
VSMIEKYRDGIIPRPGSNDSPFAARFAALPSTFRERILDLRFREALEAAWELVSALNRAVDDRKPWVLFKEERHDELDALLYDLSEGLRWLAILLHPIMPERMEELWRRLGSTRSITEDWSTALTRWGGLEPGTRVSIGDALFPRIELAPARP